TNHLYYLSTPHNTHTIKPKIYPYTTIFRNNSTINTVIKGKIIMPTGGNTNAPKINPTIAAYSPFLLPPYVLTKYLLAIKSEIIKITVKTIIINQKTSVRFISLDRKSTRLNSSH